MKPKLYKLPKTDIEWADYSFNPITGCQKISEGCRFCYAESYAKRFWGSRKFEDQVIHEDRFRFQSPAEKGSIIFVNSMSDLFYNYNFDISPTRSALMQLFDDIIPSHPEHYFAILTKRPEEMADFISRLYYVPENVWLGVSVENQETADERLPILLSIPKVGYTFVSCEPLIGRINIDKYLPRRDTSEFVNWVIVGSETGRSRRDCSLEWVTNIVNDCIGRNTPVFVKQYQALVGMKPGLDYNYELRNDRDRYIYKTQSDFNSFTNFVKYRQFPYHTKRIWEGSK